MKNVCFRNKNDCRRQWSEELLPADVMRNKHYYRPICSFR